MRPLALASVAEGRRGMRRSVSMAPAPRNTHTAAQQEFIVRKLAAFEPPRAISAAFVAVYPDVKCNENDILAIDPETTVVTPELHALFLEHRERVLLDPKSAPFADQKARLIALSAHAKFYGGNNQFPEQRAVFRQIAEEQGVVGGKAGAAKPADTSTPAVKAIEVSRTVVRPTEVVPQ